MTFRKGARIDASQVDDLRGRRVGTRGMAVGGGGAIGLVVLLVVMFLGGSQGGDLGTLIDQAYGQGGGVAEPESTLLAQECRTGADANERDDCRIVGYVTSIQSWWTEAFDDAGRTYAPAKTRFFSGGVQTSCGAASSEVGPFYCPADRYVYIDLGFFDDLRTKYGATGGPMAQAYILAHEYGHHVQRSPRPPRGSLGRDGSHEPGGPDGAPGRLPRRGLGEPRGRDGLPRADHRRPDRRRARTRRPRSATTGSRPTYQGRVTPESWTHGSSEQRQEWFLTGLRSGDVNACDTSGEL